MSIEPPSPGARVAKVGKVTVLRVLGQLPAAVNGGLGVGEVMEPLTMVIFEAALLPVLQGRTSCSTTLVCGALPKLR